MKFTGYDALSFDCYGTLIDWEAGIAAVLGPWAHSHGLDLDDEALLSEYSNHEARTEHEHPTELYPDVLAAQFHGTRRATRRPRPAEEARKLAGSVPDWPAFTDSHDALIALGKHFKLIILSNVDRQSFVASSQRLDVTFDEVLTAQDIGSYKPADRNFQALLNRRANSASSTADFFTSLRACSMITSRRRRLGFRQSGSTVATIVPAGAPLRHRPLR